jgi:hypothetical protein
MDLPPVDEIGKVDVFHSATAIFYAPSDNCGVSGMHRERIRSSPCWRKQYPRRDTVFVELDPKQQGMHGLAIGRVYLFLVIHYRDGLYPCALLHWFRRHGDHPDPDTGLWIVRPEYTSNGRRSMALVSTKQLARGAHLMGVYGSRLLPEDFHFSYTLDSFHSFFVNSYADHHMHEFVI